MNNSELDSKQSLEAFGHSSNDYTLIIPTYKRYDTLFKKTLKYLEGTDIDFNKVVVYVASEEELEKYKEAQTRASSSICVNYAVGVVGLAAQRNYICNQYLENEYLVFMDDDISSISILVNNKLVPITKLKDFIVQMYKNMKDLETGLCGIYPVYNAFFMRPYISEDLKYICGGFYSILNKPELQLTNDNKEDFERTLQYYKIYGKVLRYNFVGIDTKGYTGKGGLNSEEFSRDNEELMRCCNYLLETYPNYCLLNLKKKNGKPELKLIDKTKLKKYI